MNNLNIQEIISYKLFQILLVIFILTLIDIVNVDINSGDKYQYVKYKIWLTW
ncbi:MAG: hypothetical protein KatS3mg003_1175 [Candidatus Nitrosocaldaceae archaeon]|nr:MAG: hypothetical protein KatS3mg003_1175 [Candidatus Nitrosocaldaceae archaeon]